ncbi:MAG TPA: ABC transporter permease [Ktedonosporobacter sp.]|nr:ABC transporter permease [Ktedonosporobacter sp.]
MHLSSSPLVPASMGKRRSSDVYVWSGLRAILLVFWRLVTINGKMMVGSSILTLFLLIALFGPLLTPYSPIETSSDVLLQPSAVHWLGTTQLGQDVFAQIMYGTRYSIFWGIVTALMVTALYVSIGLIAGYFGGFIDEIISLITNVFLVLPGFALILIIVSYIPFKGPLMIALVLTITGWPGHTRIIRSQILSIAGRDFIEAARSTGLGPWRIIFVEILPNLISIVAAGFIGTMLGVILAAAGLDFLGLGDPSNVSWGSMLFWVQQYSALLNGAWWWFVPPGVCIALLGVGLTLVNLGIDEIADPRLRGGSRRYLRRKKELELQDGPDGERVVRERG